MSKQTGNFAGKVAFVTGAGSGIGRASALAFARQGANVVTADYSEKYAEETRHLIEEAGGKALAVRCDVSQDEDVKAALDKTRRLDFAFKNAGINQGNAPPVSIPLKKWERVMSVNVRGTFLCLKYEIPLLLEQVADGYRAMDNRSAIKALLRP